MLSFILKTNRNVCYFIWKTLLRELSEGDFYTFPPRCFCGGASTLPELAEPTAKFEMGKSFCFCLILNIMHVTITENIEDKRMKYAI